MAVSISQSRQIPPPPPPPPIATSNAENQDLQADVKPIMNDINGYTYPTPLSASQVMPTVKLAGDGQVMPTPTPTSTCVNGRIYRYEASLRMTGKVQTEIV